MSKESILIVEDNNIVMLELKERLTELGYNVIDTACCGPEAIEKAKLHLPDLIMMDIRLKGAMDGIETAAKIKDELGLAFIYLTAHTDEGTLQRAKLTEPYGYIIKPFEERELHSTIEMAIYKHHMEIKLKESEKGIKTLMTAIPDIVLRFKGDGTLFDYHTPEGNLLFPQPENLTGRNVYEIVENDLADKILHYASIAAKSNEVQIFEHDFLTDKGVFYSEIRLLNNFQDEFILVMKDITIRKRSQLELKALNVSKDKFFSIIAHDLRSPFNSLIGFSSFLASEIDNLPKEDVKSISESISKSVKSIFGLLENLLEWSRIKTGRLQCDPKEVVLEEIIDKLVNLFKNNLESKNISLSVKLEPGLKTFADINMLETILRNLISNSIKFTRQSGQIYVTTEEDDNYVLISVKDTGVGMSENVLSKLFKIDENISTNGTQHEPGSGLGLILCKEFAELNHGQITVRSKINEGSLFCLKLPKIDKHAI